MTHFRIRAAHGIRNDVSPERFSFDNEGKVATYVDLQDCVNCDLDETGKLERRLGAAQINATPSHSLWTDYQSDKCYVVQGGVMCSIDRAFNVTPVSPATTIAGRRVSYARADDSVYCSDGVANYHLDGGNVMTWGIAVPPVVTPTASVGQMRGGKYMCAMTYVRNNGEESGAPVASTITLTDNQSLLFSNLPVSSDPTVVQKRIYVSDCNGELLYLAATLMNSDSAAMIANVNLTGMPLRTQFFGPLPAGEVVGYHSGRLYVASQRQLWYSAPYEYGLCDLRSNYITFQDPVRTFASVSDGIFVGTSSEILWLGGTDPTQFAVEKRAAFGSVLGTERSIRSDVVLDSGVVGATVCWMGQKGLCFGFDGGAMKNTTGSLYAPPEASEGAGLLKIRSGTPQYVVTLFA